MHRTAPVISQIYGGGGNAGATLTHDFIEVFNPADEAVSVDGWSVQYASAAGTSWQVTTLAGSIPARGYYLVQQAVGTGGTQALPTPDRIGSIAMSATAGKVVLASQTTALTGACPEGVTVVDRVGFGGSNCGAGTAWLGNTPTLSNTTAALRNAGGCAYTGDPSVDFVTGAPAPRNSASPTTICDDTEPGDVASVTVAPEEATVGVGATQAFTATARDADENIVAAALTWSSSDPDVATVDADGVATAVAPGTVTITATAANEVAGSATLTVVEVSAGGEIVISQIYGGGGNAGAQYTHDFIEIFNRGDAPVDVTGWSVQYTSAVGTAWQATALTGVIAPGRYLLVQQAAGAAGTAPLPTPDVVGTIAMGAAAGKVLLATTATPLTGACPTGPEVVDRVGYGAGADPNGCVTAWNGRTAALSNTTAALRRNDGCVDTGSAAADFDVLAPNPRHSASPVKNCVQPPREDSDAPVWINELMGDPANAESASWGEWFEVHNYGTTPIDLQGWTILSGGTSQPDHVIASSVVVPAGGYAVLGRGADIARNGGVQIDYNYFTGSATTIWLDDADYLMLLDADGARVDSVAWTSLPRGVTKGRRPGQPPTADVDGPGWGYASSTFGDGDYGTPGALNAPLQDTPPFVSANRVTVFGRVATDAPLPVGFEAQLFASLLDGSNQQVPTTFTWQSLTPAVASVDERGVIRALAAGMATFRVTAADGTARNHTLAMETPVAGTVVYRDHTEFGVPVDADPSDDLQLRRTEFAASWNGGRGIPNWVAYHLSAPHIAAGQDRCNCFTFDPLVEAAGHARYTTADYTGAGAFAGYGIDRGHLARSFDRTSGSLDNARTYYFSNIIPQTADQNQGPWAMMENQLGDRARFDNRDLWIYAGATGSIGTVKGEGLITIPEWTWKVAVIMPSGQGLADVRDYRDVEVVAAVMPNIPGIRNENWQTAYRVTVDSVEKLSGYHLLGALPANVQRALKTGTQPPIAMIDAPASAVEGQPLSFGATSSVDPNGTIVDYAWAFGDGATATGSTATHTYQTPGHYTARLVVTDNDGLVDTATAAVHVRAITVAEGFAALHAEVSPLIGNGIINTGIGISLLAKIRAAEAAVARGQRTPAVSLLKALVKEVDALERARLLSAERVQALRAATQRLIRAIGS